MPISLRAVSVFVVGLIIYADIASAGSECKPACRSGFVCIDGQCVSECNPPCSGDRQCRGGECVRVATASDTGSETTPGKHSWNLGAKTGLLFPGTVYIDDVEADTELGFMLGSYIDALVIPKLSIGGYVDFFYTTAEYSGDSATVFSLGATLKGRFQIAEMFELRPGIALGYNYSSVEGLDDGANGFNIAAKLEAAVPVKENINVLVELSFLSQPAGGTGDLDVTWTPIFFLAAGIEYAD